MTTNHTFLHVGGQFNQHGRVWHVGTGGRQALWRASVHCGAPAPRCREPPRLCRQRCLQTLLDAPWGSVTTSEANWSLACKDALVFHIILERKYFKVITT